MFIIQKVYQTYFKSIFLFRITHHVNRRSEENSCIMMAAKMVSRHAGEGGLNRGVGSGGYDWCIGVVKASKHTSLAYDLDIDKAINFLKHKHFEQVSQALHGGR